MKEVKTFYLKNEKLNYCFNHSALDFLENNKINSLVIISDENILNTYPKLFSKHKYIIIPNGEKSKNQITVNNIIKKLLSWNLTRQTILIGLGGGVVTDITGFVASIFLRGLPHIFIPTTLLAMVDASVGGKTGINCGVYKNMIGTFKQPQKIIFDSNLLKSLPQNEWENGFAEIIKHACILDSLLFKLLQKYNLSYFQKNIKELNWLIKRNVLLKNKVILSDEKENSLRAILNFGHTFAHAIENNYQLDHGKAVAYGMVVAGKLSEEITNFKKNNEIINLLTKYNLPTSLNFDIKLIFKTLQKDKKKTQDSIHYILLKSIGKPLIKPIHFVQLKLMLKKILNG